MRDIIKVGFGVFIGMILSFFILQFSQPFQYWYDGEDKMIFNIEDEIVSDYNVIEWRFEENKGTTFEIYFEKE